MRWYRIVGMLLLCISLIGCQEKELTVAEKKQIAFDSGITFTNDNIDSYLAGKSEDYKNLFKQEYGKAFASIVYDITADQFSCQLVNTTDYTKIVQNDVTGFQKDYENLLALEMSQNVIDNYVWSYARNAVKACGSETVNFQLDLDESQKAFLVNDNLLDLVSERVDALYSASINYTTETIDAEWVAPTDFFELNKGRLMCVNCGGKIVNCFIVIDTVKEGDEAKEFVRGLSSINKDIDTTSSAYVVTYTITNLSEETVTFEDKIVTVNEEGYITTFNSKDIVGLENTKKLEPLVETTITNLYIGNNSGGLFWYDSVCNNILGIDLIQN